MRQLQNTMGSRETRNKRRPPTAGWWPLRATAYSLGGSVQTTQVMIMVGATTSNEVDRRRIVPGSLRQHRGGLATD